MLDAVVSTLPMFQSLDIVGDRWILTLTNGAKLDKGPAVGIAGSAGSPGPAGRGVSSTAIVGGDLVVTYSDGSTINAGHVLGEPGSEGRPGRGIAAAEVNAGHLVLTYSDGATATLGSIVGPAGATGAAGRGIQSSVIQGGRLVLTYTDGATADLGNVVGAAGAAGRGIASTAITNGHLIVSYTDGTSEDKGQVVGATGATGAANLSTFRRVYVSSVELTGSNGSYGFAGVVPAGATEVEVECVGGGASGYSLRTDNNLPGHGGNPGQVTRRRLRVADVPSPIAVTIGAGGMASSRTSGRCYSWKGDDTAFGTLLKARGGEGGSYAAFSDLPPGIGILPGDVPSGPAGRANGSASNNSGQIPDYLKGTASMGPGGGGAGIQNGSDGYQAGGAGGDSGIHLPASTKQGGLGGSGNAAYTYPGANASDVWGYGSGGGGGYWNGGAGGSGGIPGGGGGGGGGNGGAGGRGAIRLHFYRYEAP